MGDHSRAHFCLLGGLLLSGRLALELAPELVAPPISGVATLARAVAAGGLVGVGTALSNGCTSGHGLCGLGRLSPSSLAAVGTFMAAGAVTCATSGTLAALSVPAADLTPLPLDGAFLKLAAGTLAFAVAVPAALCELAKRVSSPATKRALADAGDVVIGTAFGAGLALSGMADPAKVVGFLAPLTPSFDPSLAFVMGGALAIIVPAFAAIMRQGSTPVAGGEFPAHGPAAACNAVSNITPALLAGAALFGSGWGLLGACPGPALVQAAANPSANAAAFWAATVGGQVLAASLSRAGGGAKHKAR